MGAFPHFTFSFVFFAATSSDLFFLLASKQPTIRERSQNKTFSEAKTSRMRQFMPVFKKLALIGLVVLVSTQTVEEALKSSDTSTADFDSSMNGSIEINVTQEIQDKARHSLDLFHYSLAETGTPLVFMTILLVITIIKGTLRLPYIHFIPESVSLMVYGLLISFVISKWLGEYKLGDTKISELTMPPSLFFVYLLPAIVSDAGLSMQKGEFFQSLPKTLMFAVFGTIFNTIMLAITMWTCQKFYIFQGTPFMSFFLYATLMSAVDPVSVLSTFSEIDVKRPLFTLIFGESLLNDAITIVLYRTALNVINYNQNSGGSTLTFGEILYDCFLLFFCVSFFGILIGLVGAFAGVLLIKRFSGHQALLPIFQLIIPYILYLIAETFHYSGILACIASSMFMSHYMKSNVCVEMEFVVFTVSKTFASIAEMIIFIFLGLSSVAHSHKWDWNFIIISFLACLIIRAIMVVLCSFVSNKIVRKPDQIDFKDQMIVTHAGIRGAVCFGLVQSIDPSMIQEKEYFVTSTLMIIALTSLFQGCTIKVLMNWLKIEGDNGLPLDASNAMKIYKKFDKNVFRPLLTSKSMYLPTDETFKNLGLPKAVSTALRIGERSHTDLVEHGKAASIARPTASPFEKEILDDENLTIPAQPSTGRRTPVQRASIYSRHFFMPRPQSPRVSEDDSDKSYLTCPATIQKKRPTFNPNEVYNQSTFSGPITSCRVGKRHNSTGDGGLELKPVLKEPPREKKISRTVVSGNKTFVVDNDELSAIDESPKKPDRVVFKTPDEDSHESE
ncbi:unnamed protein product [Caenorhabditis angaria]|uniref:Sodium/hydrogen exchanger n=1 Tax=Caenorhabditis angaria TaxID=860376 RepID=A0A9P1J360_9PELO|nr:unnamed protein product [Caenorhabditis angaria]